MHGRIVFRQRPPRVGCPSVPSPRPGSGGWAWTRMPTTNPSRPRRTGAGRLPVCDRGDRARCRRRAPGLPGRVRREPDGRGIDWGALRAGDVLTIGEDGLTLELTDMAGPCQTIAHWFVERRIARISPKLRPEDSRWYARVLVEGRVAPGDRVEIEGRAAGRDADAGLPASPSGPRASPTASRTRRAGPGTGRRRTPPGPGRRLRTTSREQGAPGQRRD